MRSRSCASSSRCWFAPKACSAGRVSAQPLRAMDYYISVATFAALNVILALGLNLISGFCGQVSLGHAAFYGLRAYAAALGAVAGPPLAVSLLVGTLVAGAFGILVGLAALRVRDDSLAIVTMGVGFLFLGAVRKQ